MRPGEAKYPHIFSPGKICKFETKNRIKYAATETNFNFEDGFVHDREVAYMRAIAKGGPGIVTTQGAFTDPTGEGKGYVGMMGIYDDKFLPGLKQIADAIHEYDSMAILQLMDCGRVGGIHLDYTVGPSVVPQKIPRFREPRELTVEQIEQIVQNNHVGALRTVEAGYDAVEISGIVGYLVSNFNSAYTNIRTDAYGGSVEKRAKFMCDIVKSVRKAVGPDFPILIRLCGEELLDDRGGNTPAESRQIMKMAIDAGVDLLSVTAGWQESAVSVITRDCAMGSWLRVVADVRKDLPDTPLCMAYRLFVPEFPEAAIANGTMDFWEMCRPMIADPDLPNKIAEDRQEDIIPCMACNLCLARLFRDQPLTCMVRPWLGHEEDEGWQIEPAETKKKVVVIGAGPAGMECAATAAERGHEVIVYEKDTRPGGQLLTSCHGPAGDDEFMRFVDHLETRCKKAGVAFRCAVDATVDLVAGDEPDAVVLAAGTRMSPPDIPGIAADNVITVRQLMRGEVEAGKNVVILGGRGIGIAAAQYLLEEGGHEIAMVESAKKVGRDVNPSYVWRYVKKLKQGKVQILAKSKPTAIGADGVSVAGPEGEETILAADTIVLAMAAPANSLQEALEARFENVHVIGDAAAVRRAHNATMDGYKIGLEI
jgi:2,4-dienoyl-CoA reductase-like NADH-dependent reductase (Old Yellow Enzyme family)/thioredoxin reductase